MLSRRKNAAVCVVTAKTVEPTPSFNDSANNINVMELNNIKQSINFESNENTISESKLNRLDNDNLLFRRKLFSNSIQNSSSNDRNAKCKKLSHCNKRNVLFKSTLLLLITLVVSSLFVVNIVNAQSLANSFFTEPDVHPGFVSKLGPKSFQLLSEYLRQRVAKFMKFSALQYNSTMNLTPLVRFSVSTANLLNFDAANFQSQFSVVPEKEIIWTGSNLKITVNSNYKLLSNSGEVRGQFPITFEKSSVQINLLSNVNPDGHLKTDLQKCHASVGELRLDFSLADVELLRNYLPLIHRAIREQIDNLLCPTFNAELVPVIANRLLNTPMSAALFDHYFINYGLIGPVNYSKGSNGSIELYHRGNVFGILRQGRTRLNDFRLPFRSAPLLISSEPQQNMVTFEFSNYTISSLLFWMDQYRKFDFEISKNSVNDSNIAGYLRTECGPKDICAGTLFPALSQTFSNGVVSIKTHTVTFPHVRLEKGKAIVIVDSRIDAFVNQPDKSRRFLTASMLAELNIQKATFKDYTLKGQLVMDTFKITDVVSLIDGIDAGSIEFLINALNELIIADDMAKKLKEGIKLPILFDFEQSHSEVHFEQGRIWIGADYCFEDNCKQAAVNANGAKIGQNTDMDVNYYDATG